VVTVPLTWTVVGKCKLLEMVKRRKENAEGLEAALQRVAKSGWHKERGGVLSARAEDG
jgi:hypothetical protein